jgi:putative endonuclease
MDNNNIGELGEKAAVKFLENLGYKILDRNYQNNFGRRLGEIDIIAKEKEEIVFVEVKTREYRKYRNTDPEENVTSGKIRRLAKIATAYLRQNRLENSDYRFDVISVWLNSENNSTDIKHIISI